MRETNREQIRRALDECLSGMDGRPSLEKRVLARAKGERRGPRRRSLALAGRWCAGTDAINATARRAGDFSGDPR